MQPSFFAAWRELFRMLAGTNWRNILDNPDAFDVWAGHLLSILVEMAAALGLAGPPVEPFDAAAQGWVMPGSRVMHLETGATDTLLRYTLTRPRRLGKPGYLFPPGAVLEARGQIPLEQFQRDWRAA